MDYTLSMFSLEDKLRPPYLAVGLHRDVPTLVLALVLLAILAQTLQIDLASLVSPSGTQQERATSRLDTLDQFSHRVTQVIISTPLLMALGMVLAMRCGAIDLSVWVVSALGGVVAATCIGSGVGAWAAMLLGVLAGAAVGAMNGLLVAAARMPSALATLATAGAVLLSIHACLGGASRSIAVSDHALQDCHITQKVRLIPGGDEGDNSPASGPSVVSETVTRPLYVTRMVLVGLMFVAVLLVVVLVPGVAEWHNLRYNPASRLRLALALTASGALSAAAGVLWMLDSGSAPVPTRLVDDLTVPAAALLAGGLFLGGKHRTLLACILLPAAILMATLWRQQVWLYEFHGYPLQLLLLIALVIGAHRSLAELAMARRGGRGAAVLSVVLAAGALIVLAASALVEEVSNRKWLHLVAIAAFAAGMALLMAAKARRKKPTTV